MLRLKLMPGLLVSLSILGVAPQAAEPEAKAAVSETVESKDSAPVVHADAKSITPLAIGVKVPEVTVRDVKGNEVRLREAIAGKPAIIIFYRGGWCPYCNAHLADLSILSEELQKRGVPLIAISPDKPERLAEAIKERPLPYTLLSDSDHKAMTAFGVAYTVDADTEEKLKGYNINLTQWSGSEKKILPVPSVFITDGEGVIRFEHANADYTVRMSADDVRRALDGVLSEE